MTDTNASIQRLLESNPLREPVLRQIIRELKLPKASHGLDAGCGIGLQTLLLLDAIGSRGQVNGVDILPELLAYGTQLATAAGRSEQVIFRQADVRQLPFDDHSFDWVWSADCVGYPAGDSRPALRELIRVTKPGGRIILMGWSSQQVLPGYPLLEARLNTACSSYNPFLRDQPPEAHFLRASSSLRRAGLNEIRAQTFVGKVYAPLSREQRIAMISLLGMLWDPSQLQAGSQDGSEYQRLCTPASPDFILNLPDYYAFFTYSVFEGKVVKK